MRPIVFLILAALSLRAQASAHTEFPTRVELDSITARGIDLYEYDRAAWLATDAFLKTHPKSHDDGQYVVYRSKYAWIVRFGRLSAAKDTFYTLGSASKQPTDSAYIAQEPPFPVPSTDYYLYAARAVEAAANAFGVVQPRPYNHTVIPRPSGDWLVYLYPAQTTTNVWPLGGDERFRISADGLHILERHRMHRGIRDMPEGIQSDAAGNRGVANFQADILDNRPEDSYVFAVLSRKPSLPAVVGVLNAEWAYEIYPDGRISLPKNLKR